MSETNEERLARIEDQISGKNGLQDGYAYHDRQIRDLQRFQALLVGGSAVATVALTIGIEVLRHFWK